MTSDAALLESIADAFRPRPEISLADWCAQNLRLPADTSATPGYWDLSRYPYWRGVLDAAEDTDVEEIVILTGTQMGKTTTMLAILAALSVLEPAPAMLAAPDKDATKELREKFYGFCEASDALKNTIPPSRLRNDRWIDVGGTRCYLAYAYNTQTLSGKSCKVVLCTEVDRWRKRKTHGDPSLIVGERVKAFHRSLVIRESTPSDEHSRIVSAYQASDQRRFLCPCPHCGHRQELRFFPLRKGIFAGRGGVAGLKNEKGEFLSADQVQHTAHYLCEQGCRIEIGEKTEMVAAGQWAAKGVTIDKRGKRHGTPLRGPRVAGFRLNSLYAETVSFAKMATKYLECRGKLDARQVFFNDWLAAAFKPRPKVIRWRDLWRRLQGAHAPGSVPGWAIFLTAACDPGPNYLRWTVRAWGEGSTSALVDWGTTRAPAGSRTAHIDALRGELLERHWPLVEANDAGDKQLQVRILGIDVGYKPRRVHDWFRSLPPSLQRKVRMVAGKQDLPDGAQFRRRNVEVNARDGKPYVGGMERWEISRAHYNGDLIDRWKQSVEEAGAWWLTNASLGQCELYLREITNEAPTRKLNKEGRMVTVWQKIDKHTGNHFGDTEAINLALADMVTGGDWTQLAARKRRAKAKSKRAAKETSRAVNQDQPYGRMRS